MRSSPIYAGGHEGMGCRRPGGWPGEEEHVQSRTVAIRQEAGVGSGQESKGGLPHLWTADRLHT